MVRSGGEGEGLVYHWAFCVVSMPQVSIAELDIVGKDGRRFATCEITNTIIGSGDYDRGFEHT